MGHIFYMMWPICGRMIWPISESVTKPHPTPYMGMIWAICGVDICVVCVPYMNQILTTLHPNVQIALHVHTTKHIAEKIRRFIDDAH